jgi:hypothetical protein
VLQRGQLAGQAQLLGFIHVRTTNNCGRGSMSGGGTAYLEALRCLQPVIQRPTVGPTFMLPEVVGRIS